MIYEFCTLSLLVYIIFKLRCIDEQIHELNKKHTENAKVQMVIMESQLSLYSLVEGISNILNLMYKVKN